MASENKLLHLLSDMDHYHKAYACFKGNIKPVEIKQLKQWTDTEFEPNVVSSLTKSLDQQQIRFLGIGSGGGIAELYQLQKLAAKFPKISASVVEPSNLIIEYQDTVVRNPIAKNISFQWHRKTFDEFLTSNNQKYHFVSVVHSIYFLGDPSVSIRKLYKLLEPGGILLLVLVTGHTGTGSIPLHHSDPMDGKAINNMMNSSQVKAALDQLQIEYTQSKYTLPMDITDVMSNDHSEEADMLLDFLTYVIDFRKSASDDVRDRVMRYFQENSRIEKVDDGDEKVFFDTICDILLVTGRAE
ncbi:histamine N-methyltransferase-like [Amphiura filiformis]|uniref:histamine N-methyltransferase-like n=1 Tax=Amphiura filiformis TaxID=82378 RepID=UPI003B214C18